MITTIEEANEAKKILLGLNRTLLDGKSLILSVTIVLGDSGYRLEAQKGPYYDRLLVPTEIGGIPVVCR